MLENTVEKSSAVVDRCINNWWTTQPSNHISGILPFFALFLLRYIATCSCMHILAAKQPNKSQSNWQILCSLFLPMVFVVALCEVPRSVPMFMMSEYLCDCCCFCKYFLLYLQIKNRCLFMTSSLRSVIMFMRGWCWGPNFQELVQHHSLKAFCS